MEIKKVGVVGAGTMGNGIAHVFARSGFSVVLCDVEQKFLDRGLETIGKNLDREVAKAKFRPTKRRRLSGGLRAWSIGQDGRLRFCARSGYGEV